ncbi:hypothetical protein K469DRAFT_335355 [Zopfia rhizophila CBS 207.26]|uniref:BZIP domain-containing protein n=1 Tax=Zopfia rhizophila CBS 207.26 TaxID=1314779 RepID=A0A6A6DFR2_9PEZI|nr:hypothetical protein K469DRAFT_335355 [Zopfia rhizophila CBS 207.26]
MTSNTSQQLPSSSKPGRKRMQSGERLEATAKKPKKVNSEIRKQQNRIASRNYREKRKRKLQYLQHLLQDQPPTDQQPPKIPEANHEARTRSISAEYRVPAQAIDSVSLPSGTDFNSLSSNGNMIDPATTTFNSHPLATSQPFAHLDPSWNASIYDRPAQVNVTLWNVPQWIPSIDFTPQMHAGSEDFQFIPPHTQQVFDQIPTPSQQHQEPANADLFILGSYGHCRRPAGQSQGISSCVTSRKPFNPSKHSVYI